MLSRQTLRQAAALLLLVAQPAGAFDSFAQDSMAGADSNRPEIYRVPWRVMQPAEAEPAARARLYWFPSSPSEARASPLLQSRTLTLAANRCVVFELVTTSDRERRAKYSILGAAPAVIFADAEGTELARETGENGRIGVSAVEKMLRKSLDQLEDATRAKLDEASARVASDVDAAIELYLQVAGERCLFSAPARKAEKALRKLGR